MLSVSPYQVFRPSHREAIYNRHHTSVFTPRGSTEAMAAIARKQHVDEALEKVSSNTWCEPLGKALAVTGTIVSGLGNFVPGLGILGGALSLGSKVLNLTATSNVRRKQATGCIDTW